MTVAKRGTIEYVLVGQTLTPSQPVTIGDTTISITSCSGHTVLFVGNTTAFLFVAWPDKRLPQTGRMKVLLREELSR